MRTGRLKVDAVGDDEAVDALRRLARREGVLCALESAHAVAGAIRVAKRHAGKCLVVGISGRGDKDMPAIAARLEGR
jgi:tryptophan synthase beta chain